MTWEVEGPESASDRLDDIADRYSTYLDDPLLGPAALTRVKRARRTLGISETPRAGGALARAGRAAVPGGMEALRRSLRDTIAAAERALADLDRLDPPHVAEAAE